MVPDIPYDLTSSLPAPTRTAFQLCDLMRKYSCCRECALGVTFVSLPTEVNTVSADVILRNAMVSVTRDLVLKDQ